jgi:ubiquinone biosynthesis protein
MTAEPSQEPLRIGERRRSRLGRQRQVAAVLTRHGFGLLVQRTNMPIPGRTKLMGGPESLRTALQELGTTFIKLGQILGTRSDLLPESYIVALSTLQDRLPPVPLDMVRAVLEQELGAPPEQVFAHFEETPLATASIGQVHAATLLDGSDVVVKVRKPGISEEIELDLAILHDLAHLAAGRIDSPLMQNLEETVEHFADGLRDELDCTIEGRNIEQFASGLHPRIKVTTPRVYWDYTTPRVLTASRFHGVKVTDGPGLASFGVVPRLLARELARMAMHSIFVNGFFHADPHPGNYIVQADGTIAVIDFGLVGRLDDGTRRDLLLMLAAWVSGDADDMAEGLLALGVTRGGSEFSQLKSDMRRLVTRYHGARLKDIQAARMLSDVFGLARRRHLVLRGDLTLMAKTLAMHEGIGLALDPQFHLPTVARPFVRSALRSFYMPSPDRRAAALNIAAFLNLAGSFPSRAQRLLNRLERGEMGVAVRPEGMDPLVRDLNRMVNRLSVSILTASFIVGLALVLQTVVSTHGSRLLLLLFAGGLLSAGGLGLWLLASMYQAGKIHRW